MESELAEKIKKRYGRATQELLSDFVILERQFTNPIRFDDDRMNKVLSDIVKHLLTKYDLEDLWPRYLI